MMKRYPSISGGEDELFKVRERLPWMTNMEY